MDFKAVDVWHNTPTNDYPRHLLDLERTPQWRLRHLVMKDGRPTMAVDPGSQWRLTKYLKQLETWMQENPAVAQSSIGGLSVILEKSTGKAQLKALELLTRARRTTVLLNGPSACQSRSSGLPARLQVLNELWDAAYGTKVPKVRSTYVFASAQFSGLSLFARIAQMEGGAATMTIQVTDRIEGYFWSWLLATVSETESRSLFLYELRKHLYTHVDAYNGNADDPYQLIRTFGDLNVQPAINGERSWLSNDERYESVRLACREGRISLANEDPERPRKTLRSLGRPAVAPGEQSQPSLAPSFVERYPAVARDERGRQVQVLGCRYFSVRNGRSSDSGPILRQPLHIAKVPTVEMRLFNKIVAAHCLDFQGLVRPPRLFGGLDLSTPWLQRTAVALANSPCQWPPAERGRVLIIGAGNTGLLAGLMMRSLGFSVEILDRDVEPIEKKEVLFLTDDALFFLEHLGVLRQLNLVMSGQEGGGVLIEDLEQVLAQKLLELGATFRRGLDVVSSLNGELVLKDQVAGRLLTEQTSDYANIIVADGPSHSLYKILNGKQARIDRSVSLAFAMLFRADSPRRNPQRLNLNSDPRDYEMRVFSHPGQTYVAVELSAREFAEWSALANTRDHRLIKIAQQLLLSRDHVAKVLPESIRVFSIQPSRMADEDIVGRLGGALFYVGDTVVQGHFMLGSTFCTHVRTLLYLREHLKADRGLDGHQYVQLAAANHQGLWKLAQRCFFHRL